MWQYIRSIYCMILKHGKSPYIISRSSDNIVFLNEYADISVCLVYNERYRRFAAHIISSEYFDICGVRYKVYGYESAL